MSLTTNEGDPASGTAAFRHLFLRASSWSSGEEDFLRWGLHVFLAMYILCCLLPSFPSIESFIAIHSVLPST
jgi:hypothetical protein